MDFDQLMAALKQEWGLASAKFSLVDHADLPREPGADVTTEVRTYAQARMAEWQSIIDLLPPEAE